jgi:hypothetical protein
MTLFGLVVLQVRWDEEAKRCQEQNNFTLKFGEIPQIRNASVLVTGGHQNISYFEKQYKNQKQRIVDLDADEREAIELGFFGRIAKVLGLQKEKAFGETDDDMTELDSDEVSIDFSNHDDLLAGKNGSSGGKSSSIFAGIRKLLGLSSEAGGARSHYALVKTYTHEFEENDDDIL